MNKPYPFGIRLFLRLSLLGILAACAPSNNAPVLSLAKTTLPTATPLISGLPVNTPAVVLQQTPTPVPAYHDPNPLVLTFPTPASAPVSLWRPPLYPAPWALNPNDHFYFTRPIAADEVNWPLANYRYGGVFYGTDIIHTGIDIDAKRGTTVLAAAPGKVISTGYGLFYGNKNKDDPYGLAISIRHDFGYKGRRLYTIYAHLDRIDVVPGQRVETGTQLGAVGNTGKTTGPHLHFEVRMEENSFYATRNPELWLTPPEGWGVLVGQLRNTNGSLLEGQDVKVISKSTRREWVVRSYAGLTVRSDDYYQENLALSDLPAGDYTIKVEYKDGNYLSDITIHPGAITYFSFRGEWGYKLNPPPTPSPNEWLDAVKNKS